VKSEVDEAPTDDDVYNQIKEYGAKIKHNQVIQPISEENVFQLVSENIKSSTSKWRS